MRKKIIAIGALVVAGASYLTGVLTAPKSGKETRKDIAKSTSKLRIDSEKQLKKLHSDVNDLIGKAEKKIKPSRGKVKDETSDAVEQAKKARSKAKEVLSALHNGDADDPNLKAALKEIKQAKKDLSAFLKKK